MSADTYGDWRGSEPDYDRYDDEDDRAPLIEREETAILDTSPRLGEVTAS